MAPLQKNRKLGYLNLMTASPTMIANNKNESNMSINHTYIIKMRRLFKSLLGKKPEVKHLNICPHHIKKTKQGIEIIPTDEAVPYSKDHCLTCNEHLCLSCSESHVNRFCEVDLGVVKQLGEGVLRNLNLGEVIKVEIQNLKCICGKPLGRTAAICAACGMASCSEECHQEWQKLGNCVFGDNFYSIPEGFTMRSILFDNIKRIQNSKSKEWILANKSTTTMLCCYATGQQPFVYLQRGFRNYGRPNPQLLAVMKPQPRGLDYWIHFERRCDCACSTCSKMLPHGSNNCHKMCLNFDMEFMKLATGNSKNHKQCSCPCDFCQSGVIFNTHRYIDCMMFCRRSQYWKSKE